VHIPTQFTCRNLARVNEDAIDFELLEELIAFIDDSLGQDSGAILVFLPGEFAFISTIISVNREERKRDKNQNLPRQ